MDFLRRSKVASRESLMSRPGGPRAASCRKWRQAAGPGHGIFHEINHPAIGVSRYPHDLGNLHVDPINGLVEGIF